MVRIEIKNTGLRKLTACMRFPLNYPDESILIELKSKTLSESLLQKLTSAAESEAKLYLKKSQILNVIKFLKKFLDENSLSVCYDEITHIKALLNSQSILKLKQKLSTISIKLIELNYFFQVNISIPQNYFDSPISISDCNTNLPSVFERFLLSQSLVIGKQCSEPSATRLVKFKDGKERLVGGKVVKAPPKKSATHFEPSPSLQKVVSFLIKTFQELVNENCQICKKECLPADPLLVINNENDEAHIERVYCGHLFHLQCLLTFMKTPPFQGGKKCPSCCQSIYHDKWRLSERLAEDRWAHEQAKDRELKEIAEFFY